MAIGEFRKSRREHISQRGHSIEQIFTMTWAEWDAQGSSIPKIGDAFSVDRNDLICRDVTAADLAGSTDAKITAQFSTMSFETRQFRPDQVASWHESMRIGSTSETVEWYINRDGNVLSSWFTVWIINGGGTGNAPPLPFLTTRMTFNVTCYGTTNHTNRILTNANSVNSVNFLSAYSAKKTEALANYTDDMSAIEDSLLWMFMGSGIEQISATTIKYDMQFEYDPTGWQSQPGIFGGSIATNQYKTFDFMTLFEGMDKTEEEEDIGLHG